MVLYSFHTKFDFFYFQENIPTVKFFCPFLKMRSLTRKIPTLVRSLIGLYGLLSLSRILGL